MTERMEEKVLHVHVHQDLLALPAVSANQVVKPAEICTYIIL